MSLDEITEQVLSLPTGERAELLSRLLRSLEDVQEDPAEVEAAWREEILRRAEAIDRGEAKTIPWAEARRIIFGSG